MTVQAAKERRDRRKFAYAQGGIRTYRRTYLVVTDTKTDGPQAILNAPGLPTHMDPYSTASETDYGVRAVDFDARQMRSSPLHWEVDVSYTSDLDKEKEEDEAGTGENDGDPLSESSTVITFGFEVFRVAADEDFAGDNPNALVNSSGQKFDPAPMIDDSRPVLTVSRNQAFFNPLQAIDFKDAVNNDQFSGADAGQVKMRGITATKEIQRGNPDVKFWRVTYVFLFHREGWKLRILDSGTRINDPDSAEKIPYTEDGIVTEVRLDGAGNKLDDGDQDYFLEFDVYKKRTFASLGLNNLLAAALAAPF